MVTTCNVTSWFKHEAALQRAWERETRPQMWLLQETRISAAGEGAFSGHCLRIHKQAALSTSRPGGGLAARLQGGSAVLADEFVFDFFGEGGSLGGRGGAR